MLLPNPSTQLIVGISDQFFRWKILIPNLLEKWVPLGYTPPDAAMMKISVSPPASWRSYPELRIFRKILWISLSTFSE